MTRHHLSTRERARIFELAGGICHLCGFRIQAGQEWDVSHPIALELGGEDVPENRQPAHRKCHQAHTAEHDAPLIAKGRRVRARHIGAHRARKPMMGSKASGWKHRMDGTWERR